MEPASHLSSILATLTLFATSAPLAAHEFWIDANAAGSVTCEVVSADILVGQDLSGDTLPYLDTTIETMTHFGPTETRPIAARLGDRPAINGVSMADDGLHILTAATHPSYITFDEIAEFEDYLAYEGQSEVAVMHRMRGLPVSKISEEYIRNARALVQVGPAEPDDVDRATGMPFELVVDGTPFIATPAALTVRLIWQGAAAPDVQIAMFYLPSGGSAPENTIRTVTRSDPDGYARFAMSGAGQYMLNAVRIDPVEGPGSVVWQSHWASLAFDVTGAKHGKGPACTGP